MRKFIIIGGVVLAAMFGAVASADAHTLSKYRAANAAYNALDSYAINSERYFEVLTGVDPVPTSDCFRMSAHRVDCLGSYEYETLPDYEYTDGSTYMPCLAEITVRYPSRYSRSISTRVHDEECF